MQMLKRHHSHKAHRHKGHHRHGRLAEERSTREKEMIANRVVLVSLAGIVSHFLGADPSIVYGFGLYLIISLSTALALRIDPSPSKIRLLVGLIADFSFGIFIFETGGGDVAAVYPLYLWIILGYGFRFGVPWLIAAAVMATASFGWVIYNVEFWQENRSLSIGLLIGLLVVPAYCSTLITKISQAKEEAEEANKAKSLFLANISHELRTPLNAIIGYGTHLLEMDMPKNQNQMVATSVSAGRHLLHLINQLLNFAQTDSREELPEPQEFVITDVLAEVRDIMQIAANEKGLQIHLQAEPLSDRPILGQVDHVRNILINLTSNAVKFTEAGHVTLKCGVREEKQGPHMWLSVSDTGPGIPEKAREKIFEVFQQADDSIVSKFGGTGLGLAICRQLALQMEGDVSLESELGVGSTFKLDCPISFAEDEAEAGSNETLHLLSLGLDEKGPAVSDCTDEDAKIIHVQCAEDDTATEIIEHVKGGSYELVMIDQALADLHAEDSAIWDYFRRSRLAPVLIGSDGAKTIDEIRLRAAFASVIPATPDFDTIRSVVQIGCSFSGAPSEPQETVRPFNNFGPALNILIADDNRTNQMVLETILSNAGHEVCVVPDGERALEELEANQFDLVFLDVNMPKIGGIECAKLWRQIEGPRAHIPIIGLTADSTDETEKKCLDAGMDLRLTKPIEAGTLLEVIAQQTATEEPSISERQSSDPFGVISAIDGQGGQDISPAIDPAQMEYLLSIGDEEFVQSIVDAYLEDTKDIMTAFKKSVEEANVSDFRFHAHAFKSGANNVGALTLSEMCSRLEVITEQDFEDRRLDYLDQITVEVERIKGYLSNPLQIAPAPSNEKTVPNSGLG